jgi:hypothetical protein
MTDIAVGPAEQTTAGAFRRCWPAWILACGVLLTILTIVLGCYVHGRIVLIGPLDAVRIVALLGAAAVWCPAIAVMGWIAKVTRGRFAQAVGVLMGGVIGLGTLGLSAVLTLLIMTGLSVDSYYKLDVPGSSSSYIVSNYTYDETSLTLYRGNGIVYEPVPASLPLPARQIFERDHRVDTDTSGRSFLVYEQASTGQEVRIPLP